MSYRSIKRVLGETSLERKCRFLFGVCLFFLIFGSFWWYSFQTEKIVNDQNLQTGKLLVVQELGIRHWKKWGSKEESQSESVAAKMAEDFKNQDFEVKFILPSPPEIPEADYEKFKPDNKFEKELLEKFLQNDPKTTSLKDTVESDEKYSENGEKYFYYQAIRAKQRCVTACHQTLEATTSIMGGNRGTLGFSTAQFEGDLMAVARIEFSTGPTQTAITWNKATLLATAIVTVFLAMLASYVIVRYVIVKPLRHLRDVSDSISRGDISQRADIHTGDEFEELAVAFNRMLRHLTTIQEELRQVNASLDGKVDELAQVNMRLYEMNMLKSDFLSTMSHELRTPLNSILGFSDVLGAIDALDEKQKRYVQNIQKSGRTLLEMINDILDLAKIESGKMGTRPTEFRIDLVVGAQCDMARPLSEKKNIDLECHLPADPPPMLQDQARVQQILNNLLSNAIKFTPEGGRISVSVERDARDFMVLKVGDTGVGIAAEDQQAIFEKFRQGRTVMPGGDAMTREHSGTGLGLSIIKELCKLLGGEVSVQSELGKGSTFTVRLPWRLEEPPRPDSPLFEGFSDFGKPRIEILRSN
ncbi:MAG: HAMP domain-containing protein [Pirellulales bacterium]|nr:HAMP domain-containing protein [Pirellulales bacterium]